jgi:hypothetical protein
MCASKKPNKWKHKEEEIESPFSFPVLSPVSRKVARRPHKKPITLNRNVSYESRRDRCQRRSRDGQWHENWFPFHPLARPTLGKMSPPRFSGVVSFLYWLYLKAESLPLPQQSLCIAKEHTSADTRSYANLKSVDRGISRNIGENSTAQQACVATDVQHSSG